MSRPRPPRPYSPQPIRRIPADVTFGSLGACTDDDDAPGRERGAKDGEHDKEPELPEHKDQQVAPADDARGRTTTPSPRSPSVSSSETAANPSPEPTPADDARE